MEMFKSMFTGKNQAKGMPSVVIIGAGVAGIAAASSLLENGISNVTVLEASDRIGGRVHTANLGPSTVDLGAHWIHGEEGNAVFQLANKLGLAVPSGDFKNVEFICDDETELPAGVGMGLFDNYQQNIDIDSGIITRGDHLNKWLKEAAQEVIKDQNVLNAYIAWADKFQCSIEGSDHLSEVSVTASDYVQCNGDSLNVWKSGGFYNIINILMKKHPSQAKMNGSVENTVILNSVVKKIDWGGLSALVSCTNGKMYRADHVIVTVSLGVLKEKHHDLFTPPLPEKKITAIRTLGFGTVDKIYLQYENPWWPKDCSGFSLLHKLGLISVITEPDEFSWERDIIGFYVESTASNVLGAWLIGDAARSMETHSDKEVIAGCIRCLRKFVGHKYNVTEPKAVIRSKWYLNQNFRGSYSFRSVNSEVLQTSAKDLSEPVSNFFKKKMLFFAGEATHPYYYSTVHGAVESGWREAYRISKLVNSPTLDKCGL